MGRIMTRMASLIKTKAPAGEILPEFPDAELRHPLVYVCSDIHGEVDRYRKMLREISFSLDNELYILGDVIDRFPYGVEILQDIMSRPNVHLLLGNHEDMCMRAFCGEMPEIVRDEWIRNDGEKTYASLSALPADEQAKILAFIAGLPDHLDVEVGCRKFHLVHAFPSDDPMDRIWSRPTRTAPNPFSDKRTVIVGHTPVFYLNGTASENFFRCLRGEMGEDEHFKIAYMPGFIDIDCGCGIDIPNRRLACLRLNDMKEIYV